MSILLTDDETVRSLNKRYRGFDQPTDVLSFAQLESMADAPRFPSSLGGPILLGDVVISVDAAERQAAERNVKLTDELCLLTVHGILHLLGYEDETEAGAEKMDLRQRDFLPADSMKPA